MKLIKKIALASLVISVYVALGFLTDGNLKLMLMVVLAVTFIASAYFMKVREHKLETGLLLGLPTPLLFLGLSLYNMYFSTGLMFIFGIPLFTYLGYLVHSKYKCGVIILSFILYYLITQYGFVNFLVHSNITIDKKPYKAVQFIDAQKNTVQLPKDKIVVLDFWTSSCAPCFSKFPDLEETYQKYKNDSQVQIYAVNAPLERDSFSHISQLLTHKGYTFPQLFATSRKAIEDTLSVNYFPRVMIIKNDTIYYQGSLETDEHLILNPLEEMIEALKKQ